MTLSPLTRFLLIAGVIYIIWYLMYDYYLLPDGRLDAFLSLSGVNLAGGILNIFGWDIYSESRVLAITGTNGVEIQNGCNGLELIGLYMGFILSYPGGTILKRVMFLIRRDHFTFCSQCISYYAICPVHLLCTHILGTSAYL